MPQVIIQVIGEAHDQKAAVLAVRERLDRCYSGRDCQWNLFYRPRQERANCATRYHLVYPALAYFIQLKKEPDLAAILRPKLDTIYRGLLDPRTWRYWHDELHETTWPLQERNLTFAGRLATFVGFYIDAFGAPPAGRIELGGRSISYSELSDNLHRQMAASPNCGVSCYHHRSMVMCNAHMLINNVLHDRLFGTNYAQSNASWLKTVDEQLTRHEHNGPIFYYGTEPNLPRPAEDKQSVGADIWALFLMSGVVPDRVGAWFERWQHNITRAESRSYVEVSRRDAETEFASDLLASAWAFCLAKELAHENLARQLRCSLDAGALTGYELDPLLSGLYLLGELLEPGAFHRLVVGD